MTGPTSTDLLVAPHHDGSPLYVSTKAPALGDTVTVRIRVPHAGRADRVHVRSTPDAEPLFVEARPDGEDERETWWAAEVTCHNPVTGYRFLLEGGEGSAYRWVNGTGTHLRDVPDAHDFRIVAAPTAPPAWATRSVVYQVFPDRFARSAGADERPVPEWAVPARWDEPVSTAPDTVARQLYGGDLDGVAEHLDHLASLGVTVLYLTPVFPSRSNHRYDASSFDEVDPVLGGTEALARLVDACHDKGIRVMGDFTSNHTGDAHEWFVRAQADPGSPERSFYFWRGADYVGWLGVKSLPKLDWDSTELWRRVLEDPRGVVRRWLTGPHALDGWRVDVANMTGRYADQDRNHAVAAAMRAAVHDARPDGLLVGEHAHDYTADAQGLGWHGVMNYSGFTRPVWTWLRDRAKAPTFMGVPAPVPLLGGGAVVETITEFAAGIPWTSLVHSFVLVGSHDTTRVRTLVGDDPRSVVAAAGLLFTLPGIPMVTYGDEVGMRGEFGEDGRRPMPWDESAWDTTILEAYRTLGTLRGASPALQEGGLRWVHVGEDCLVFLREAPGETALVHVARGPHDPVELPTVQIAGAGGAVRRFGPELAVGEGRMTLVADGPGVGVWTWPT